MQLEITKTKSGKSNQNTLSSNCTWLTMDEDSE